MEVYLIIAGIVGWGLVACLACDRLRHEKITQQLQELLKSSTANRDRLMDERNALREQRVKWERRYRELRSSVKKLLDSETTQDLLDRN